MESTKPEPSRVQLGFAMREAESGRGICYKVHIDEERALGYAFREFDDQANPLPDAEIVEHLGPLQIREMLEHLLEMWQGAYDQMQPEWPTSAENFKQIADQCRLGMQLLDEHGP